METPNNDAIGDDDHDSQSQGFDMRHRDPEQSSLFPIEDLIIPDTLRSMRKAVSAIHASPIKGEHAQSLNSRRLLDACILIAQIDFRKRDRAQVERIKAERISPLFETRITELVRLAGIPGKNYERIYQELDQLFEMGLRWNIVAEDATVEWDMKSHFLSSLGYGKGHKRGLIRFSIDPSILSIVLEPSNWATLSLQVMQGLGTASSYALYQNAWRYVSTDQKVTAPLPTATWIQLLVGKSRYVIEDGAGGKKVQNYGDFKRRVLVDAIRRVNDIPALGYTLELKEHRSGTRVSRLQFKFIAKKSQSIGIPLTWPSDIVQVLTSIGYNESEIDDLSQAKSYEEVAEAIIRLKAAEAKLKSLGKPISSKKAYFNGILSNIATGASGETIDYEQIEMQAKVQEAQKAAALRQERAQQGFSKHQTDVFAANFFAMDDDQRHLLLTRFDASPQGAQARLLVRDGWTPRSVGAFAILKGWVQANEPELAEVLLPNPEDRSIEAWMAWRLEALA